MYESEEDPQQPSKSQRKRDMIALQKLGETLLTLNESQLAKIEMSNELLEAIRHAKSLTSHEAKRRQLQYIGKIMRHIDVAPIEIALKHLQHAHETKTEKFHAVEEWREKLITGGDEVLGVFVNTHSTIDRQLLRQMIRKAQLDRKNNKNTGGEKALFKYLSEVLNK